MDTAIIDRYVQNFVKKTPKMEIISDEDKELKSEKVISSKDGLVEKINKKYITDDGKQLLID